MGEREAVKSEPLNHFTASIGEKKMCSVNSCACAPSPQ